MVHYIKTFSLIILVIITLQCTERKRLNPIDPQNPETHGKPIGLNIYSEFDTIVLSWQSISIKDMLGYKVYRKTTEDSIYKVIHLTPPDSNIFYDQNVSYNHKYSYCISVVTKNYESPHSDELSIVPGPTIIWLTDVDSRRIIKLSHDGIHEIGRIVTDGYPWDIEISHQDRSIWFSDVLWGRIYRIVDNRWELFYSLITFWNPVDIELDEQRNILWVADENGSIIRISPGKSDSLQEITNSEFEYPVALAIDKKSGDCWFADATAKKIFIISSNGSSVKQLTINFNRPIDITINNTSGSYWVADRERILKLTSRGDVSLVIMQQAYVIAVDQQTGELWAGDDTHLMKFDEMGNKLFEISGFDYPGTIVVNPYDNGCVVVDTGNGQIVRISANGEILSRYGDYYYPWGADIEFKEVGNSNEN